MQPTVCSVSKTVGYFISSLLIKLQFVRLNPILLVSSCCLLTNASFQFEFQLSEQTQHQLLYLTDHFLAKKLAYYLFQKGIQNKESYNLHYSKLNEHFLFLN